MKYSNIKKILESTGAILFQWKMIHKCPQIIMTKTFHWNSIFLDSCKWFRIFNCLHHSISILDMQIMMLYSRVKNIFKAMFSQIKHRKYSKNLCIFVVSLHPHWSEMGHCINLYRFELPKKLIYIYFEYFFDWSSLFLANLCHSFFIF